MRMVEDKIKGVLYGCAVGDALGLGAEYLSKISIADLYPWKLRHYSDIAHRRPHSKHLQKFKAGEWTDDTEQMLLVMDSLLDNGCQIDPGDLATLFRNWLEAEGKGSGSNFRAVVLHEDFLRNPYSAAFDVWEASGREIASNGAVMRTAGVGLLTADLKVAADVARTTHADPRCVLSCVVVTDMIRKYVFSPTSTSCEDTVIDLISLSKEAGVDLNVSTQDIKYFHPSRIPISDLELGMDRKSYGYTYKAMGAGLWALWNANSFAEGLYTVIDEGGDTDTNAAVAGALLGARFGYKAIPYHLIEGLQNKDALDLVAGQVQKWDSQRIVPIDGVEDDFDFEI